MILRRVTNLERILERKKRILWLQTTIEFWLGGGTIFLSSLNIHGVNDVRQTEILTAEPLGPESSAFEVEKAKKN